ncbi:MAG: glycolate oxidase iron-sulfur subunit [Alphaproteobacteria bacterium]|nr:glycolate oxidase iron-sulfur subunit [Alphaproteobacteria bacterium]
MQTRFSEEQYQTKSIRESAEVLRRCVHCGFCTATCPTFQVLGDEADSPRGRIWMIRDMLEKGGRPEPKIVKHIDRCLSCLGCKTTCPSGVDYMRLVDHARAYIHQHHQRPFFERLYRRCILGLLVRPNLFRVAIGLARPFRAFRSFLPRFLGNLLEHVPARIPDVAPARGVIYPAQGEKKSRLALLHGCATAALGGEIHAATIRVLTSLGHEVVMPKSSGCCGALHHHNGDEEQAKKLARANVKAWMDAGVDGVIINASGCGTTVKDYAHLLEDEDCAEEAKWLSAHSFEVIQWLDQDQTWVAEAPTSKAIAYHPPCSMQHGQGLSGVGERVLHRSGFKLRSFADTHLCCGSAGTYSLFQPEIAHQLRHRKAQSILKTDAQILASVNLGCMNHLAPELGMPTVHIIQLIDWALHGEIPPSLRALSH